MTESPRLALTRRDDLPAAVAYLLGYHPTPGSLAALAIKDRQLVTVIGLDATRWGAEPDAVDEAAAHLANLAAANDWALILLVYGTAAQTAATVRAAFTALQTRGVDVPEALRVDGDRLHCLLCQDCAPGGVAFDITTARFSATATYAGRVAHPDRAALADRYAPVAGTRRTQMDKAIDRAITRVAAVLPTGAVAAAQTPSTLYRAGVAAVDHALHRAGRGSTLEDDTAAWLLVLLHHLPVRDHAWQHGTTHPAHVQLWADLTRRARVDLTAPPACWPSARCCTATASSPTSPSTERWPPTPGTG